MSYVMFYRSIKEESSQVHVKEVDIASSKWFVDFDYL